MDKLETQLKKVLEKNGVFDVSKSETLRKELIQMQWKKNMFRVKMVFWTGFVLSAGISIIALIHLYHEQNTRSMIFLAVLALIGYNSMIFLKLWLWVANTKLTMLQELKQLQLQIAELAGEEPPSEN
jgi:hypothetical protein